ncbi:MAG: glucose-1-phosphate thymidylyltransferase [Gammaproteobacteria bacterium]|nr:glucose-1-phosphate thymidylyltransferase [Gammaproteobacteria bacterium]
MTKRKGIILAGGSGTRLHPMTLAVSKQLLNIYDKPMIYYPLSTLMMSDIRDICIITSPNNSKLFKDLLGDGSNYGIDLTYIEQPSPDGLAQAYLLAENFLNGSPSAMILGDNIFYGSDFEKLIKLASKNQNESTIFGYQVRDPRRYGVVDIDDKGKALSIIEKPKSPKSNLAVTGLYFLDGDAPNMAKEVTPSPRGELEITSLLELYMLQSKLKVEVLKRGNAWLDTGTFESLNEAGNFVKTLQARQGIQIGCLEEIAFKNNWISIDELNKLINFYSKTDYGQYLKNLI